MELKSVCKHSEYSLSPADTLAFDSAGPGVHSSQWRALPGGPGMVPIFTRTC